MKILVTGREGQLVRSLVERSQSFPSLDLIAIGRPELDLANPASIAPAIRAAAPDVVVNAAAYTAVDLAEDEPDLAARINGMAAGEIAAAARDIGARIVQISTDYVFDGRAELPYNEGSPVNPLGVYGRSKLAGEEQVRHENTDHVIVRTAWVYSPFGHNFVKTMMRLARDRDEVNVVDDQRGNPSSAHDLADGLLGMIASWDSTPRLGLGETYHLAGTGSASWHELADHVFAECARLGAPSAAALPIATDDWPTRARRPKISMLDCAKFAGDFSFRTPPWRQSASAVVERLAAEARD